MSERQLQRVHVIGLVEGGKITLKEAGKIIGVSYRQAKRIRRALQSEYYQVKGKCQTSVAKETRCSD